MGRSVLAYQFVAGLLPNIKLKLAGTEGSMDSKVPGGEVARLGGHRTQGPNEEDLHARQSTDQCYLCQRGEPSTLKCH